MNMVAGAQISSRSADSAAELRFLRTDIERWADFSGDRNPIHFDLEQARKIGAAALVVHGMLTLLPIKQIVTRESTGARAQWMRHRALFRFPVLEGMPLLLTRKADGVASRFRASGADSQDCIRGTYGPAAAPDVPAPDLALAVRAVDRGAFRRFGQSFGDEVDSWVALDAVIFADFMATRVEALKAIVRPQAEPVLGASVDDIIIVHASHTVTFDQQRCATVGRDEAGSPPDYAVSSPQVMSSGRQVSCTMTLPVWIDEEPVMMIDVGLVLRPAGGA